MVMSFPVTNEEGRIIDKIVKTLEVEEVEIDNEVRTQIINLVLMRKNHLDYKNHVTRKQVGLDLQYRLGTITRVAEQLTRDGQDHANSSNSDFVFDQLFLAVVEKSCLLEDSLHESDIRNTQGMDFHLWRLKRTLTDNEVEKPIEVIADVLEKSGFLKNLGTLKASSIKNKCSRVQQLVDKSKNKGACHTPRKISDRPRASSPAFVKAIAGNCENCEKIWTEILGCKDREQSSFHIAAETLFEENEKLAGLVKGFNEQISKLPLKRLIELIPDKYSGVFADLAR